MSAIDANGKVLASITSPKGEGSATKDPLNARPWTWSFGSSVENGKASFSKIEIEYVGTSSLGGFAFDNFNSTEGNSLADSQAFAAPLPAGLPLGIIGLAGLIAYRRRRQRKTALAPATREESEEATSGQNLSLDEELV